MPGSPGRSSMAYTFILVERRDAVATITLNRPDVLNALNWQMRRELELALDDLDDDETVRGVVLRRAGRAFFAGAFVGREGEGGCASRCRSGVLPRRLRERAGESRPDRLLLAPHLPAPALLPLHEVPQAAHRRRARLLSGHGAGVCAPVRSAH